MLATSALIVLFLFVLNGFFAMSELAVVSSRRARLQQMEAEGSKGAAQALRLAEDPTSFLSTVQIGITLVGIFTGAYGASVFAGPLAAVLEPLPVLGAFAEGTAIAFVVIAITYLNLVIGELVAKRFALAHSERVASFVAPFMQGLAKFGAPFVWLLRGSPEVGEIVVFGDWRFEVVDLDGRRVDKVLASLTGFPANEPSMEHSEPTLRELDER